MSKKNIEVEVRGPISEEQYLALIERFNVEGKKLTEKRRTFIDYSTFLEGGVRGRDKDIRIRVTNGVPEIIVKLGNWGGAEARKELSVLTEQGSFETLAQVFGELGFTKGILGTRNSVLYEYQGVEFALVEVPGHSYYYEAERMIDESQDSSQVIKEIQDLCKDELALGVFSEEEFFSYIETLNEEANQVFDYSQYQEGDLAQC
jgi:predicted adenylyl cyclase CyaB